MSQPTSQAKWPKATRNFNYGGRWVVDGYTVINLTLRRYIADSESLAEDKVQDFFNEAKLEAEIASGHPLDRVPEIQSSQYGIFVLLSILVREEQWPDVKKRLLWHGYKERIV